MVPESRGHRILPLSYYTQTEFDKLPIAQETEKISQNPWNICPERLIMICHVERLFFKDLSREKFLVFNLFKQS